MGHSVVCFHHPFLNSLSPLSLSFQVVLPSQSPSHFNGFGFIFPHTSVSSDLLYLPIVRGWILSRFTLYLSRKSSLFLFLYRLNHKFREPFAIHICKNNKVFFQILSIFIYQVQNNLLTLVFFVKAQEKKNKKKTMD